MAHRFPLYMAGLTAAFLSGFATSATAASVPTTRLVSCGEESCLLVTGRRTNSSTLVSINGHAVAPEGNKSWRVRLPLATVRAWAAPGARTVTVELGEADGKAERSAEASLPIGLLGHVTNLAALVVRAH